MIKILTKPWPVAMIVIGATYYLYEFFLRVAPSAMFSQLMEDFQINATDLGALSGSYFFAYSLMQIPAGVLIDKFGPRRLLTLAIVACAAGAYMFASTSSYSMAIAARLIIGAASGFAFISCLKIATLWFKPKYFPILTGFTLTLGSIGAIAGEAPISYGLQFFDWRTLIHDVAIAGFVLGAVAWIVVRDNNPSLTTVADEEENNKALGVMNLIKGVVKNPQNWLIALYGAFITGPVDAFGGLWGVPYLVHSEGLSHFSAAAAVSMTFVGLGIGSPLFGWLANAFKSRRKAMILSSGIAAIALISIIYSPSLPVWLYSLLFFAFGVGGNFVLSFVVVRDINPIIYVATAGGFVNMMSNFSSMSMQYLIGLVLDLVWDGKMENGIPVYSEAAYKISLMVLPITYILCVGLIIFFIKESYPHKKNAAATAVATS